MPDSAFSIYSTQKKAKKNKKRKQNNSVSSDPKKFKKPKLISNGEQKSHEKTKKEKNVSPNTKTKRGKKVIDLETKPITDVTFKTKKKEKKISKRLESPKKKIEKKKPEVSDKPSTGEFDEFLGAPITAKKRITPKKIESDDEVPTLVSPKLDLFRILQKSSDEINFYEKAQKLLYTFINPVKPAEFFEKYWECIPLYIKRDSPEFFKHILSSRDIDEMLREHPLYFGRNVDVVTYKDGKRSTENPEGRAKASIVWDAYSNGHSIRILNPQTYNKKVQMILSTLQEYFGAMVGANVYLTPAGSQGFAPHYDDIEAFIIQLEGRKHWKLYQPTKDSDNLARFSSKDYNRNDLGALMLEITLNAGDTLYFPRGVVHEAKTDDEKHSLHMTISTYQRTSYVDLLEKILPEALNRAAENDIEFRKGLPIGYLNHVGVVNSSTNSSQRKKIIENVKNLLGKLAEYADVDSGADQLGRKFMYEAVPPVLTGVESLTTSLFDGEKLLDGKLVDRSEVSPDTKIRLIRQHACHLVIENNEANLYYCTDNSKVYHGEEEQFITIENEMCPVIQTLIHKYPDFVSVEDLPGNDITKKITLITELWDYGIVRSETPLEIFEDDKEEEESIEDEEVVSLDEDDLEWLSEVCTNG